MAKKPDPDHMAVDPDAVAADEDVIENLRRGGPPRTDDDAEWFLAGTRDAVKDQP